MDLDRQLKILIDDAPKHGVPSLVMQRAVTPVLEQFARQLQHPEYYILQTASSDWLLTTLSNRQQPQLEKKVIYAFATAGDAAAFNSTDRTELRAIPMPVTHILFQLFATRQVDSIVFMSARGLLSNGVEIHRPDLQKSIQSRLAQLSRVQKPKPGNIPPNIA